MKYMLLIYQTEGTLTDEDYESCLAESMKVCDQLASEGKFLAASPLEPVVTAATVRVRDGQELVTDGPFAETTEQLGGFYVLDLVDLDEAISVSSRLPPAKKGTVEVRPLLHLDGLPPSRPLRDEPADGASRRFLLLCYSDEEAWRRVGPEALRQARAEAAAHARELDEEGRYLDASPLHGSESATSVRVRDGRTVITDGPFAETTEVLGGYFVILARSRDEALRFAARHPGARRGAVEVRPLTDLSSLRDTLVMSRATVGS